jgi:maltooligosyltrehalose synthase
LPDERYEKAVAALVDAALTPGAFLTQFAPFASRVARLGVRNSLVQLALKLTAPGVPDLYQGTETWDLSLVDPDNRRRVDFARRAEQLAAVDEGLEGDRVRALQGWLRQWQDGRIKLATTRALLALRARAADLFAAGAYEPCEVRGPRADELIAYLRRDRERVVLTAVQRFPVRAERSREWRGTRIVVPHEVLDAVDVLTGRTLRGRREDGGLDPAELFATLPIAVREPSAPNEKAAR